LCCKNACTGIGKQCAGALDLCTAFFQRRRNLPGFFIAPLVFLPVAFEKYCMNKGLGIAFREMKPNEDDYLANCILRGRELNGEPRDFNF
jgi:hypothetical protein